MFLRSKSVLLGRQVLHKSFMSSYDVRLLHGHHSIGHNGLALGEEADFEALNFLSALNLIRSTKLHLSTEPAFLPNACVCPE